MLGLAGVYGVEGFDFPKNDCGEASRSEWRVVGRRRGVSLSRYMYLNSASTIN